MNDTDWADAGIGNVDEKNTVAAISSDSLAVLLVISGMAESQGSFYLDSHDRLVIRKRTGGKDRNLTRVNQ